MKNTVQKDFAIVAEKFIEETHMNVVLEDFVDVVKKRVSLSITRYSPMFLVYIFATKVWSMFFLCFSRTYTYVVFY